MPTNGRSRNELARFLRSRRERITPTEVGLTAGPRRRAHGLRREEVAVLAGLSTTWYTYLEQGREISPSPEVLDSLARVLQMSEDERRYMHILAHGQVSKPVPLRAEATAQELLASLVRLTDQFSYPVYVVDRFCDLLAWNRTATEWYGDWAKLPPAERNILHWMLVAPEAKQRLVDWEGDTKDVVARWRAEVAKWPTHRRIQQLISDLSQLSPDFTRWWDNHDVQEHRSRLRYFRHPVLGERAVALLPMTWPEFPTGVIVFHLPADLAGQLDVAGATD